MTKAAEIAAGLSEAQKRALAGAWPRRPYFRSGRTLWSLVWRGLASYTDTATGPLLHLTPLGESVAAILKEQGR